VSAEPCVAGQAGQPGIIAVRKPGRRARAHGAFPPRFGRQSIMAAGRNPACRADLSRDSCNDGGSAAKAGLLLRGDGELRGLDSHQRRQAQEILPRRCSSSRNAMSA
jgi:hypothetical protein